MDKRQVGGVISSIKELSKETSALGEASGKSSEKAGKLLSLFGAFKGGSPMEAIERLKGNVERLDKQDDFGKNVFGAGIAILGINIVGKAFADVTSKAVELRKEFREGSKSAGDITEELIKAIPVLGNIWTAGRNIRELLGLDNNDLQESIDLQNKLNGVRRELIDILKKSNEEVEKFNSETADIVNKTAVVRLQIKGDDNAAKSREMADKLVKDVKDSSAAAIKEAQANLDAINAKLTTPDKDKGNKSLNEQLSAAQAAASKARQDAADAQQQMASEEAGMKEGHGDFASGDGYLDAMRAHETAVAAVTEADGRVAQLQAVVGQSLKERAEIEAKLTDEIKRRAAALIDASAADVSKEFGPTDPKALGAQAGAEKLKGDVAALLGGLQPVEDKLKAVDALLRERLGADAARAFANLDVGNLDAEAKAKKFLDSFKAALDGKAPLKDWFNAQLGGDALASLSPTLATLKGLAGSEAPKVKITVEPTGDIKTWITKQSGEVIATVLPKGTDLKKWLEAQGLKAPVSFEPVGTDLKKWLDDQLKGLKVCVFGDSKGLDGLLGSVAKDVPVDVLPNPENFNAWVLAQKPNIPVEALADGTSFAKWVATQKDTIPLDVLPDRSKLDALLANLTGVNFDVTVTTEKGSETLRQWLKEQAADVRVTALPDDSAFKAWVRGLKTKIDVLPQPDKFYEWLSTQKPNLPVAALADPKAFEAWLQAQRPNVPVGLLPEGDKLKKLLDEAGKPIPVKVMPDDSALKAAIASLGGTVSLSFASTFPNLTDWVAKELQGNPVSDWLERQTRHVLKGKSLTDWATAQLEEVKRIEEKFKDEAKTFKENNKTDPEKLADQLREASELLSRGLISKDDLGKFDQKTYKSAAQELKDMEKESDRSVYSLPDVKALRGQTLFAPPTEHDDKKLEKMEELRHELQQIRENADKNGITIVETN